jgi:hypothetical protein
MSSSWMTAEIIAKASAVGATGLGVAIGMFAERISERLPMVRVRAVARRVMDRFRLLLLTELDPSFGRAVCSEEVTDRELEDALLFVGQRLERKAPLEAEGPERREPAQAEAVRRT